MKKLLFLLTGILLLTTKGVLAGFCVQNNNSLVGLLGLDSADGKVYASVSSSTNECSCEYVRFSAQNTDTKMVLSILLAARMSNSKVRIDLIEAGNCDSAHRVYLQ